MLMPKVNFQWGAQHLLMRPPFRAAFISPTNRISVDELIFSFSLPTPKKNIKEFSFNVQTSHKVELWKFLVTLNTLSTYFFSSKLSWHKLALKVELSFNYSRMCAAIGVIFLSRHRAINGKCALEIIIKNYFFMYEVRICENHQKWVEVKIIIKINGWAECK